MTKTEAVALWRILTVLAGWDEIIDVAEVEPDLDYLLDRLPAGLLGPFDDDDREQMLDSLRAHIDCNAYYAEAGYTIPMRRVVDVPGCAEAGIT